MLAKTHVQFLECEDSKVRISTSKNRHRRGIEAIKIVINCVTKADSEASHLAKNELKGAHLNDFDYDVSKTVENPRAR